MGYDYENKEYSFNDFYGGESFKYVKNPYHPELKNEDAYLYGECIHDAVNAIKDGYGDCIYEYARMGIKETGVVKFVDEEFGAVVRGKVLEHMNHVSLKWGIKYTIRSTPLHSSSYMIKEDYTSCCGKYMAFDTKEEAENKIKHFIEKASEFIEHRKKNPSIDPHEYFTDVDKENMYISIYWSLVYNISSRPSEMYSIEPIQIIVNE